MPVEPKELNTVNFVSQKLESFIHQIDVLQASDFPYESGLLALTQLKGVFQDEKNRLESLPENSSSELIASTCQQANHRLLRFLPILGFILRSTNVRNSFELFDPLLRIARRLLGDKAELILSSEWNFFPHTYPLVFEELPEFVFIGLPTFQADNALIIPLAGHELGHSVWRNNAYDKVFVSPIENLIIEQFMDNWETFEELFGRHDDKIVKTDMSAREKWSRSFNFSIRQSEEIFCDAMAINIFGTSFLHAFEFLLAPILGTERSPEYPKMSKRVQYMVKVAEGLHLSVPKRFVDRFRETSESQQGQLEFLCDMADGATEKFFPSIADEAAEVVKQAQITVSSNSDERIYNSFADGVPAGDTKSLSDIINTGWKVYLDTGFWPEAICDPKEKYSFLNELIFKTIEVQEVEKRLSK